MSIIVFHPKKNNHFHYIHLSLRISLHSHQFNFLVFIKSIHYEQVQYEQVHYRQVHYVQVHFEQVHYEQDHYVVLKIKRFDLNPTIIYFLDVRYHFLSQFMTGHQILVFHCLTLLFNYLYIHPIHELCYFILNFMNNYLIEFLKNFYKNFENFVNLNLR